MTTINKQKFLAELGRLLTFMYEEDRQLALSMYERMFDSCTDVHGLMQVLVSPTRQAVTVARAYDANDRKLQVRSSSREDEGIEADEETPAFVLAINDIYATLSEKYLLEEESSSPVVLENQISFFDEDQSFEDEDQPVAEAVAEPVIEAVEEAEAVAEEAPVEESEEAVEEEPVEEAVATVEEEAVEETVAAVEEDAAEADPADAVDAFLAGFSIDESELVPTEEAEEQVEEVCEEQAEEPVEEVVEQPVEEAVEEIVSAEPELEPEEPVNEEPLVPETIRKPRVFLMILYSLFAIPVTAAGVALLLVPTVVVLALACVVILAGSAIFASVFSGFVVFADLLVVLGSALIVLAVGLILLWLFIWFIGGAIFGLIRAVVRLGSRCCYKEVAAV